MQMYFNGIVSDIPLICSDKSAAVVNGTSTADEDEISNDSTKDEDRLPMICLA